MTDLKITFDQGWSVWGFVLFGAVAVAVVIVLYLRSLREVSERYFGVLLALRLLAVVILVLFIFRPSVSFVRQQTQKP